MVVVDGPVNLFVVEQAKELPALLEEYADESANKLLPPPSVKMTMYSALETSGALHTFVAEENDALVGFLALIVPLLPHYGVYVAVVDAIFVTKVHRHTLAGLKLLARAEEFAKTVGSPGVMISAPIGHKLCDALPKMGYSEASRAFYKRF